jgi:PhoPQ-activated pathogenicity-related protein
LINKYSAIDATIEFAKQKTGNKIKKYVVAGASKRGWVTWLTAAVDKRVIAQVSWCQCQYQCHMLCFILAIV